MKVSRTLLGNRLLDSFQPVVEQLVVGSDGFAHVEDLGPVVGCRQLLILGELTHAFQKGPPVLCRRGVIQLEQLQAQVAALGLALDGLAKDVRRIFAALDRKSVV